MILKLLKLVPLASKVVDKFAERSERKDQMAQHAAVAAFTERTNGWKDEYVTVVFTAQYPTFLIGFIIDPLFVWFFDYAVFTNAAEQYVSLLKESFGEDGYKHVIIAVLSVAIGKNITTEVSNNSRRKQLPEAIKAQSAAPVKKLKRRLTENDWRDQK